MKPIMLEFGAWGPYPKITKVDFSRFDNESIFLITGPTGAGKTTVFDTISFALFGNVSGSTREKASVRSDFAEADMDTYVEFTFRHKEKEYTIRRTPKYERPKKRGEGFTTSNETAVLYMEDEKPIAVVSEVNKKIEEIMGINYEQFKQIAMIAQGEFLKLLHANSNEKVEIFRNLFKTGVYDRIQRNLSEKAKKLYISIEEQKNKMDEAIASIQSTGTGELEELTTSDYYNYDRIVELLKEYVKLCQKEWKAFGVKLENYDTRIKEQLQRVTLGKEVVLKIRKKETLESELAMMQQEELEIQKLKEENDSAKKAQKVLMYEKLYEEAFLGQNNWENKIKLLKDEITQLQPKLEAALAEVEELKGHEEKVYEHQKVLQRLEELLPMLLELSDQENKQKKLMIELEQSEKLFEQKGTLLENYKGKKSAIESQIENFKDLDVKDGELSLKIDQGKRDFEDRKQALKKLELLQNEKMVFIDLQKKFEEAQIDMENIKKIYEEKESVYKRAAVGLVARYLVENQPCPVCGSLEHPNIAVVSNEVPDEKELEGYKREYENKLRKYNEIFQETSVMKGSVDTKKRELKELCDQLKVTDYRQLIDTFNVIKEELIGLSEQQKELRKQQELRESLREQLSTILEQLTKVEDDKAKLLEEVTKLRQEKAGVDGKIAHIREKLPTQFQKKEAVEVAINQKKEEILAINEYIATVRERRENLSKSYEAKTSLLDSHENECNMAKIVAKEKEDEFNKVRISYGFDTMEQYVVAKRDESIILKNDNLIDEFGQRKNQKKMELQSIHAELEGKENPDLPSLEAELSRLEEERNGIYEDREELSARMTGNKRALESLESKLGKVSHLSREYGIVKDLDNAARGNNNQRLVFEHYVLAAYFEDILTAANQRLWAMTNGRYELMKVDKVADARTKDSLDLEVLDNYTGKRRSIKTLSGGESFKAALSLALGLSDIIGQYAGGIEIDTLFIDEGFGSLDAESLDQALRTLTTLTGRNKLIGIISHVSELKERIDHQIVVEKGNSGSELKIR